MHKFNLFENVINFLGKENRLCFQVPGEAPPAAPLSAAPTETAEAIAAREKAEREAAAKAEAEKRAAAGAEPAGQLTEGNTEKQLPKSYEFVFNEETLTGAFTATLADGTKKQATMKVPAEVKEEVKLKKVDVAAGSRDRDGTSCVEIELNGNKNWLTYQHKAGKFDTVGTDKLKDKAGTEYEISHAADGNFEIKKVEAKEAKEVNMEGRLTLANLKDLLKTEKKLDVTDEQIKKAFKYYELDGRKRGYVDGAEYRNTKKILDAIKALISENKINPEKLGYIGSVDATKYTIERVNTNDIEWHNEKSAALKTLLDFIGTNHVIFDPASQSPNDDTKTLINQYIEKVTAGDLDAIKAFIQEDSDKFLLANGIFNMALAVQRAGEIKARVVKDDMDKALNSKMDVLYVQVTGAEFEPADRKSGLLLLDSNNGTIKPERDPEITGRADVVPQGEAEPTSHSSDAEPPQPVKERKIVAKVKTRPSASAQVSHDNGKRAPAQDKPLKKEKASEKETKKLHELRKDVKGFTWVVLTQKNPDGSEKGYRFGFKDGLTAVITPEPGPDNDYIQVKIGEEAINMDFSRPQKDYPYAYTPSDGFFSKYTINVDGEYLSFGRKKQPAAAPAKAKEAPESWQPEKQVVFPDGSFEQGQDSTDEKKFKGININKEGIVTNGLWEKNEAGKWILIKEFDIKRYPTQEQCLKNITLRTKDLGININIWSGRSYNFKDLWKNTLNVIAGIKQSSPESREYMKKLGIILNQNWAVPVFTYTTQGLDKLSNGKSIVVIDYWDKPENIAKTINEAVAEHKAKNVNPESGSDR